MKTILLYPLYNLSLRLFATMIRLTAFFGHKKALLWVNGRKSTAYETFAGIRKTSDKWLWFHCASLGEYEDSAEVFETIRQQFVNYKVLLTFSSPSGFEALKNRSVCDHLLYLPVDTSANARRFVQLVQPAFVVFSRSELWLNHLFALQHQQVPTFLIGLRFQSNSNFLKWPAKLIYTDGFQTFRHIYCQDERTLKQLQILEISAISSIGNLRFTRIANSVQSGISFPEVERFTQGFFTLIAGSSLPKDHAILVKTIPLLRETDRIILVPHEPEQRIMKEFEQQFPEKCIRFSQLEQLNETHQILIVDEIGVLKYLYRYAQVAFIGGGFDRIGIHNIIEPAVYGCPVVFGPRHRNYPEALDLLKTGCAEIIRNEQGLKNFMEKQRLLNATEKQALSQQLREYVAQDAPDPQHLVQHLRELIHQSGV